jgi:hypothetical protein
VHHSIICRAWHRQGWRKVQPRPQHPKADAATPEEFKKKFPERVQEEIKPSLALGRPVRLLFEDEARLGRMSEPHRCWALKGVRPTVPAQIVREYEYA